MQRFSETPTARVRAKELPIPIDFFGYYVINGNTIARIVDILRSTTEGSRHERVLEAVDEAETRGNVQGSFQENFAMTEKIC